MIDIKRVLWVEDNEQQLNNSIRSLFVNDEKKSVNTMQAAIQEIAGEHLYDYDTIVLDIDFRDDHTSDWRIVIEELVKRIYLRQDQRNESYIKANGGYLLFLYLLECGYPSNRIAFLTGNQDIIDRLHRYTLMNRPELSRDEIAQLYADIWEEVDGDWEEFEPRIYNLGDDTSEYSIDARFTETEFVYQCIDALEDDNREQLDALIKGVPMNDDHAHKDTGDNKDNSDNKDTGDEYEEDMIFRFHRANLESPQYFSKHNDDIPRHNLEDARKWITDKRRSDQISRWLVLNAGHYMEQLWRANRAAMTHQVRDVLFVQGDTNTDYDIGIRNAFRQMFLVFDGLRANEQRRSTYYQAISAMLIPFESNVRDHEIPDQDICLRREIAYAAKQARNYCAHNYWGSSLSDQSALFLLMITVTVVLDRNQRSAFSYWYQRTQEAILENEPIPVTVNEARIDNLITSLWDSNSIDTYHCNVPQTRLLANYSNRDYMSALGWHKTMRTDTAHREQYYRFTLAAYIVKVLRGRLSEEIDRQYGMEIRMLHDVAMQIVDSYS